MAAAPDARIEIRLLGPVEAARDGNELRLGGPRQRALLALFAMQPGRVVSTDRLVEELWAGDAPEGAATSVRAYVSKLRAAIGRGAAIEGSAGGYVLQVDPARIDAHRFEAHVRDGEAAMRARHPRRAAEHLRRALDLWRGDAFGDVGNDGSLRVEGDRLEELRLHATELRAEADLASGEAADLIDELEALTAAHPYREAFWRQLMLALYRAERQADALAAYHRARRALDEQLGIEPGAALQELEAAILRQDVPGIEALPERGSLPASITSFVGRDRELDDLAGLLRDRRLVTLSGVGGVGKTRLALEAARALADDVAGGAWFVDLAPVADPGTVAAHVGAVLGIREEAGGDPLEGLVGRLRDDSVLIVLDNCEHLRAAVAELAVRLLEAGPGLRILATSREILGVAGETEYAVPPLSLPGPSESPTAVRGSEAVRLFIARAREAHPGLADDDATLAVIGRICADLDGLPLALELAAARARVLSPAEIGERLHDRFQFLVSWRRLATARHRTLREAMDWSYDLLDPGAQALLAELSTFSGGFTLEAVQAIGTGAAQTDALELVERLAEASLVAVDHAAQPTRYRVLETVRQYGAERLAANGLTNELRDRHLRHFAEVAVAAWARLRSNAVETEWIARLDPDQDNLRAALAWSLERADYDQALRMAESLWKYWWIRGRTREARSWLDRALDGATTSEPLVRARGLVASSGLGWALGDLDGAEAQAREAVQLLDGLGEHLAAGNARNVLGLLAAARGDNAAARAWFEASIEEIERADLEPALMQHNLAVAIDNLGSASLDLGDLEDALRRYRQARAINQDRGDEEGVAMNDLHVALVGAHAGQWHSAREPLADALRLYRRVEFYHYMAECLETAAALANGLGAQRTAARILGGADRLRSEVGNPPVPALARLRRQVLEGGHDALGAEFDDLVAEGAAMAVPETIEAALEFLREGPVGGGDT